MSTIAIIPARGGSKRIPKKNIKNFLGKPIIAYSIEAAMNSEIFDEIMVSTDSEEIADIAAKFGAKVPFYRSAENSDDNSATIDVLIEVTDRYKKNGINFENCAFIYPCAPFLNGDILKEAFEKFRTSNATLLMPVVKYSFPIQRALVKNQEGLLIYREKQYANSRSQDLEKTYHDAGMFGFYTSDGLSLGSDLTKQKIAMYEIDEKRAQDIDTSDDWTMAELKYRMLHNV